MNWLISLLITSWLVWLAPSIKAAELPDIPKGALGIVYIPHPETGSLPFLYGLKGKGRYITRNTQGQLCAIAPLPFVAGSLGGSHAFGVHPGQSVVLAIYDKTLHQRLLEGKKSISARYWVTLNDDTDKGDIRIESGLTLQEGFVLFAQKFWSNWFGFHRPTYHCQSIAD